MKINAFKQQIPEIKEILQNKQIETHVRSILSEVLKHLEIKEANELVEFAINKAKTYSSIEQYEREVHLIFDKKRVTQRIPVKLSKRSELIFNQIKDHLKGRDVLDLGCGDGKVGEIIAREQSRDVILADVYENGNISNINLPFVSIKQNSKIPFLDNSMDTVLLLTVLHHSDEPIEVLKEAQRVTRKGGKIIVIESVYGVKGYGDLSYESQRLINIFFDHFYNRIIHYSEFPENKVNVPFNFQTPEAWNKTFEGLGLSLEKTVHLGFDQKAVPEYHTLHVLTEE